MELCTPGSPRLRGLALALTALNLSRGSLARPRVQAEIHLLLAARLRLSWPRLPRSSSNLPGEDDRRMAAAVGLILTNSSRFLQSRALAAAARISSSSEVGSELSWLVGAEGRSFFLSESWSLAEPGPGARWGLTSPPLPLQPVAQIVRAFRDSWLQV